MNLSALHKSAEQALRLVEGLRRKTRTPLRSLDEISVLIISDKRMAQLHKRFMNVAGPTDVITFDHGEIFISADTAQRNAGRFGVTLQREIELYLIHGLLHLAGFDDRRATDARKMEKTQQRILDALN